MKRRFWHLCKASKQYLSFNAYYVFDLDFCNPAKENEKELIENLVGYSRGNFLVPALGVSSIDELNQRLWHDCINYRNTRQIKTREHSIKIMCQEELHFLNATPLFRFGTSKTIISTEDDYSAVCYEETIIQKTAVIYGTILRTVLSAIFIKKLIL